MSGVLDRAALAAVHSARSAWCFDFDGTLAPNPDLALLKRQVREQALAARVPAPVVADLAIVEIVAAAEAWLTRQRPSEALRYRAAADQHIVDYELVAAAAAEPFAGCRPLLKALRKRDRRLAIVTRNCRAAVLRVLPEVESLVDVLLTRDDVTRLKPDPEHLHAALRAVDARPAQAVLVGDGQMDMQMGRAAGTLCIGVLTGSNDHGSLRAAGADLVLQTIDQLLP